MKSALDTLAGMILGAGMVWIAFEYRAADELPPPAPAPAVRQAQVAPPAARVPWSLRQCFGVAP